MLRRISQLLSSAVAFRITSSAGQCTNVCLAPSLSSVDKPCSVDSNNWNLIARVLGYEADAYERWHGAFVGTIFSLMDPR